ncbi:secreted Ly-6/uPAR-related protein 1-like [Lissotriton helveticus]
METIIITLLAASLFVGPAYSLRCYSCMAAINDKDCEDVDQCAPHEQVCFTSIVDLFDIPVVTKMCAPSCDIPDPDGASTNGTQDCCSEDLCNDLSIGDNFDFGSGASSVKISSIAGAISVCVAISALLKLEL